MPEPVKSIVEIQNRIVELENKVNLLLTKDLNLHLRQIKNLGSARALTDAVNLSDVQDLIGASTGKNTKASGLYAWLNKSNIFTALNSFAAGLLTQFSGFIKNTAALSSAPTNAYIVFVDDATDHLRGNGLMFIDNRGGGQVTLLRWGDSIVGTIPTSWFFSSDIYPEGGSANCGGTIGTDYHFWGSVGTTAVVQKSGDTLAIGEGSSAVNINTGTMKINNHGTFTGTIPNTFNTIVVEQGFVKSFT